MLKRSAAVPKAFFDDFGLVELVPFEACHRVFVASNKVTRFGEIPPLWQSFN